MNVASTDTNQTAARLAQSIAALPPLPSTAQEILTCFGDEFIDADKVSAVVEGDPGICAKLLGLSNSAYFMLQEPVNSIEEAISRVLGVDTVRSLVLAMAIQQSFNSRNCPTFETRRFWIQSILTAECCKNIAGTDPDADDEVKDLAYSAGLCHNLGILALANMEPERTNAVLMRHRDSDQRESLSSMFVREFDTDHRIVTSELARTWSLPEPMVEAYQYRAFPESACEHRLGFVVAAGVVAVGNAESGNDSGAGLSQWADELGMTVDALQKLAMVGEKQKDRVESVASNMTG